jgi:type III pantothenate kinase
VRCAVGSATSTSNSVRTLSQFMRRRRRRGSCAGGRGRPGSAIHRGSPDTAFVEFAAALPQAVTRVVVANVAGERLGERFRTVVSASTNAVVEFVTTTEHRFGVRCAYADPSRLGVDRWVAVLAALRAATGAACVIDVGTAVTFDAVDATGSHLGGLILPGQRLLATALDRHTSDIGATAPARAVPRALDLLGKDTDTAVGHGAMLALAAALDRAVRTVAQAIGTQPAVFLTGGDAERLHGWLETTVQFRADLVLEGLALFAAEPAAPLRFERS